MCFSGRQANPSDLSSSAILNFKLAQQKLYNSDVNIHQYFRAVGRPRDLSIFTHLNYHNLRMWPTYHLTKYHAQQ